jgi:hypothetical protein
MQNITEKPSAAQPALTSNYIRVQIEPDDADAAELVFREPATVHALSGLLAALRHVGTPDYVSNDLVWYLAALKRAIMRYGDISAHHPIPCEHCGRLVAVLKFVDEQAIFITDAMESPATPHWPEYWSANIFMRHECSGVRQ